MEKCLNIRPLPYAAISWLITLGSFAWGHILITGLQWHPRDHMSIAILIIVALIAPFACLLMVALSFKRNIVSTSRIIGLFLGFVLLSANIDFVIMLHFGRSAELPFHGIHGVWIQDAASHRLNFDWNFALLSMVDCLHFSVVTLSTVGYGDIYPTQWYSKLAVDTEILMGLGITILTIGSHFAKPKLEPVAAPDPLRWFQMPANLPDAPEPRVSGEIKVMQD